ncbi:probable arginine--tRNA ligase, mitochondrial [Venturia canescens]|uniref:probable arginine--tRNA ligase, mitochondrial n=1 Tax=Venturia canescens TaxID=32260 RepID=UPI001C9C4430|nr:probable arginine--tRNA ligase, mitochondrial [Venturia canescens]
MSSVIRNVIQQKIAQSLRDTSKLNEIIANLCIKRESNEFAFFLPLKTKHYDIRKEAEIISKENGCDIFAEIGIKSDAVPVLVFELSRETLVKKILENNLRDPLPPCNYCDPQKIVVEFSSPNVAKPFHVGHLRSTIIGNYITNLHDFLNNRTTKINYLGDWGTQFGYIELGINLLNLTEDSLKLNPISQLYEAYVCANRAGENDPNVAHKAREIFESLEKGDQKISEKWQILKKYTTQELTKTYGRLGVQFDEYHWESMYAAVFIDPIIQKMDQLGLLKIDAEKRKVIAINEKRNVPIIKSDGSTLYLTRDIAAAIDRYEKYNFDLMYYVVENSQTDHFTNLVNILDKMKQPFANKIQHVKFGRIRGMSTRKGTAVFLNDILNEARDAMRDKQINSLTTKVSLTPDDNSADILGISAVVIHDLKQKRLRDYDFNWNVALDIKGETGVKLQYCHCRLVNLEENCETKLASECDPSMLREPIVNDLVTKIVQFDEAIISSYRALEPCHLVKYLFELSHTINRSLRELKVKGEPEDVGSQRLLLYRVSRNILAKGMKLLGLRPLEKM